MFLKASEILFYLMLEVDVVYALFIYFVYFRKTKVNC